MDFEICYATDWFRSCAMLDIIFYPFYEKENQTAYFYVDRVASILENELYDAYLCDNFYICRHK